MPNLFTFFFEKNRFPKESIHSIMFNKIQTYLLRRIFKDLDSSLFQEGSAQESYNDKKLGKCQAATAITTTSFTNSHHCKNQIKVYNEIINLINQYKNYLTDDNYTLIVLYFEYYHVHIKPNKVVEDNPRRHVLNYIYYILSTIDDTVSYKTITEIDNLLHSFSPTCNLSQLNDILSDLKYFINNQFPKPKFTKTTLIHTIALTFAYEVFQYPHMDDKINHTNAINSQQRKLLIQFSRFYFKTAWLNYTKNKSTRYIALDDVAKLFCQSEFDQVVEEDATEEPFLSNNTRKDKCKTNNHNGGGLEEIDDRLVQMYNAWSLAELRSVEIIQLLQEAMQEYRFRRQVTNEE